MALTADVRFTRLYEAHHATVLAYCGRRVNRAEAEDVTNEVFVVLWRRIEELDAGTLLPWLYGVAYRALANRRRSTRRRDGLVTRLRGVRPQTAEAVEDIVVRREQDRIVIDAVSRLSPADQEVLRLAAWEELSAPAIAEVMGCSVAAAEQRVHRAKKRLGRVMPGESRIAGFSPGPAPAGGGGQ